MSGGGCAESARIQSGSAAAARWQAWQMHARFALAAGTRSSNAAAKDRVAHQQSAFAAPGAAANAHALGWLHSGQRVGSVRGLIARALAVAAAGDRTRTREATTR